MVGVSALTLLVGVEGAGLVSWVGDPQGAFGFYLREAFQSQTHMDKVLYNDSC